MPLVSGHRASAKDHVHAGRRHLVDRAHELVVAIPVAAEREPDHPLADRVLVAGIAVAARAVRHAAGFQNSHHRRRRAGVVSSATMLCGRASSAVASTSSP